MKTIWKFPIQNTLMLPVGFKPLHVAMQMGILTLWAEVDPNAPKEPMQAHVIGTGQPFDETGMTYVGTAQDGPFVWHLYLLK